MYTNELITLGLSKNEAQIYEVLVKSGELSVSDISKKSLIHRRNVYDCMVRLVEKGLVLEILESKENHYRASDPRKLKEMLQEKQVVLEKILPNLQTYYRETEHNQEVYIQKGVEGWKNYMGDILKIKEDVYTIGGGGLWNDERLHNFFDPFLQKAKESKINFYLLYDHEVKEQNDKIIHLLGNNYKFLEPEYSTNASIDIFGDHVVIVSKDLTKTINDDSLTVIINKGVADAFRIWFKLMWKKTD